VLFTNFRTPADTSSIAVYSLESHKITTVLRGGFFARYTPTGHLLYTRGSAVLAVRFDPATLQTSGSSVPVIEGIATSPSDGLAQFAVSDNGTLAYITASALNVPQQLARIGAGSKVEPEGDAAGAYADPRVSPDGRRVALQKAGPEWDIWIYDRTRSTVTRATYTDGGEVSPVWTPDGRRLVFSHEEPVFHMYWKDADGTAPPERLLDGPDDQYPEAVTPDGRFLIFRQRSPATRDDIWLLPLTGERKATPLVRTPFSDDAPALSADGRWLAYTSNETGRDELYVQSFPDGSQRTQVSNGGAATPRWSRHGLELFYEGAEKIVSVTLTTTPALNVSKPVIRADVPLGSGYDTLPDGGLFALLRDTSAPPTPVYVVLNWFDELRRKVSSQ
jgi:serine/threonine-protein kinase